jgi:hypothetical protein
MSADIECCAEVTTSLPDFLLTAPVLPVKKGWGAGFFSSNRI